MFESCGQTMVPQQRPAKAPCCWQAGRLLNYYGVGGAASLRGRSVGLRLLGGGGGCCLFGTDISLARLYSRLPRSCCMLHGVRRIAYPPPPAFFRGRLQCCLAVAVMCPRQFSLPPGLFQICWGWPSPAFEVILRLPVIDDPSPPRSRNDNQRD